MKVFHVTYLFLLLGPEYVIIFKHHCDIADVRDFCDFCDNSYIWGLGDLIFWNIRDIGDVREFWEINAFYAIDGVWTCVPVWGLYSCEGCNMRDVHWPCVVCAVFDFWEAEDFWHFGSFGFLLIQEGDEFHPLTE